MIAETTQDTFRSRIEGLALEIAGSSSLIDADLNVVEKGTWALCLLGLINAIFQWVCYDLLEAYRADQVLNGVVEYCHLNRNHLDPELIKQVAQEILRPFYEKVGHKYRASFQSAFSDIMALGPRLNLNLPLPLSLDDAGISPLHQDFIAGALNRVQSEYSGFQYDLEFHKEGRDRRLIVKERTLQGTSHVASFYLPLSIEIVQNHHIVEDIRILSKKILGEGAYRKVRSVYSVNNRQTLARGTCSQEGQEERILSLLQKHPSVGLPKVHSFRNSPKGRQFIETKYDGTLLDFLTPTGLADKRQILPIIHSLLTGLNHLHHLPSQSGPIYHSDISLQNVLVKDGTAVLSDFGDVGSLTKCPCTIGYLPPEYASFLLKDCVTEEKTKAFNLKYGQTKDIWAMGLIFLSTLVGPFSSQNRPTPLPRLSHILDWMKAGQYCGGGYHEVFYFQKLAAITQKDIDEDLQALKEHYDKENPENPLDHVWELIHKMLRVDPNERISIEEACLLIN